MIRNRTNVQQITLNKIMYLIQTTQNSISVKFPNRNKNVIIADVKAQFKLLGY